MFRASRYLTIAAACLAAAAGDAFAQSENTAVRSPFPPRVERRGDLEIRIGEIRVVMRGPMFPSLADLGDGILMITAQKAEEGGDVVSIRSEDGGNTWRPYEPGIPRGAGMNTLRLKDGRILSLMYDTKPLAGKPGYYSTTRWESDDQWKTVRGPMTDGTLFLPPEDFDPAKVQWFHGNTIQLPGGELLSAMQGLEKGAEGFYPFHTFVSQSTDGGKTWEFLSRVASISNLDDPDGKTRRGWKLHGPCEHNLLHLGDGRLLCVARLVNDDRAPLTAAPQQNLPRSVVHRLRRRNPSGNASSRPVLRPRPAERAVGTVVLRRFGTHLDAASSHARGVRVFSADGRKRGNGGAELRRRGLSPLGELPRGEYRRRKDLDGRGELRPIPDHRLHRHRAARPQAVLVRVRLYSAAALEKPRGALGGNRGD